MDLPYRRNSSIPRQFFDTRKEKPSFINMNSQEQNHSMDELLGPTESPLEPHALIPSVDTPLAQCSDEILERAIETWLPSERGKTSTNYVVVLISLTALLTEDEELLHMPRAVDPKCLVPFEPDSSELPTEYNSGQTKPSIPFKYP